MVKALDCPIGYWEGRWAHPSKDPLKKNEGRAPLRMETLNRDTAIDDVKVSVWFLLH